MFYIYIYIYIYTHTHTHIYQYIYLGPRDEDANLHKVPCVYVDSGADSKQLASKQTEDDNHSSHEKPEY